MRVNEPCIEGILVGCDANQEWLLPWWWDHYAAHNSYPVAFVDFGMSERAAGWCKQKGRYISLDSTQPLKPISLEKKNLWEARAGSGIWPFRAAWFKKPLAFMQTPFPLSCWIDLDCEIRGSLSPIFEPLKKGAEMAMVREPENVQENDRRQNLILPGEVTYNSGVVAFRAKSEIVRAWAETTSSQSNLFMGDQNALSRVIYLHDFPVAELPAIYNWKKDQGLNENAVIVHYIASWKLEILNNLNQSPHEFSGLLKSGRPQS